MSRLIPGRALLLALTAAAFALLPTSSAWADPCEVFRFNEDAGYLLEETDGGIDEGFVGGHTDSTWDEAAEVYFKETSEGSYSLYDNPNTAGCTYEENGEVVFPADSTSVPGITATRKAYVGSTDGWARFLAGFQNTTAAAIEIDLAFYGDHYSDQDAAIGRTSSGDTALSTDDDWATQIDADGPEEADYDSGHGFLAWQSEVGTFPDTADRVLEDDPDLGGGANADELSAFFDNVTIDPGETLYYMDVWGQGGSPDAAATRAALVGPEPPELMAGLSDAERAGLQNWPADGDADRDTILNSADNCVYVANTDQVNTDGEGEGDACDLDDDNDTLSDEVEAAIGTDPKKVDTDADRVNDNADQCPREAGTLPNGCRAEDTPPTVGWGTPAENARLRPAAANTLAATAGDDAGVARVVFVDDGRVICEDTSAPYTCAYAPEGRDVGSNTLAAVAVDTAGQTATAFRVVNLRRFNPTRVTARTTPRADGTLPFRFTTTGRVVRPQRVSRSQGCRGRVAVTFKSRNNTISTRRVSLTRRCTYRSSVAFRVPRRLFGSRLEVQVRFLGNTVLAAKRARNRRVSVG